MKTKKLRAKINQHEQIYALLEQDLLELEKALEWHDNKIAYFANKLREKLGIKIK